MKRLITLAIQECIKTDNISVLCLSRNYLWAVNDFKECLGTLELLGIITLKVKQCEITLPNKSRLIFKSSQDKEQLRGLRPHFLVDEYAFRAFEYWNVK